MKKLNLNALLALWLGAQPAWSAHVQNIDVAAAFGARPAVEQISLSPDGAKIAFIAPDASGQGSSVLVAIVGAGDPPRTILHTSGQPTRLRQCNWISNRRMICSTYGVAKKGVSVGTGTDRYAVDFDGGDLKPVGVRGYGLGSVVDWLSDDDDSVLIRMGRGVGRLDTRKMKAELVENGDVRSCGFMSDGHGNIRIMELCRYNAMGEQTSELAVQVRPKGGGEWVSFGSYDSEAKTGFYPMAIDPDRDVVVGGMQNHGKRALFEKALDGKSPPKLIFAHDDVDLDALITLGRSGRPVGARYVTDTPHSIFFDPPLAKLAQSLGKALPHQPTITFIDTSGDEAKLLLLANSDDDPGTYYLLDRKTRQMTQLLRVRSALDGHPLAKVKPVEFPAADGTKIPAYLTLPIGSGGRHLPTIVMPHGDPGERDEWGFDWVAQYFVARGFAVLQPQYRGSAGYGEDWSGDSAFKSWRLAVGDVRDAGRWLVAQGIADPARLAIVGKSFGGYAALQAAAIEPLLFKAVVGIAPITDPKRLKLEHRYLSDATVIAAQVGTDTRSGEEAPTQNASRMVAPVLLLHAENDLNVSIAHSRQMVERLKQAGKQVEFVSWPALDHQLQDSAVRADLLRQADAFLRKSMGM